PSAQALAEVVEVASVRRRGFHAPVVRVDTFLDAECRAREAMIDTRADGDARTLVWHELDGARAEAHVVDELRARSRLDLRGNVLGEHRDEAIELRVLAAFEARRDARHEKSRWRHHERDAGVDRVGGERAMELRERRIAIADCVPRIVVAD